MSMCVVQSESLSNFNDTELQVINKMAIPSLSWQFGAMEFWSLFEVRVRKETYIFRHGIGKAILLTYF